MPQPFAQFARADGDCHNAPKRRQTNTEGHLGTGDVRGADSEFAGGQVGNSMVRLRSSILTYFRTAREMPSKQRIEELSKNPYGSNVNIDALITHCLNRDEPFTDPNRDE